jgi:hypothetical protein
MDTPSSRDDLGLAKTNNCPQEYTFRIDSARSLR